MGREKTIFGRKVIPTSSAPSIGEMLVTASASGTSTFRCSGCEATLPALMSETRPHILCLGGGWVAVKLVRSMRPALWTGKAELTVVSRDNYLTIHGLIADQPRTGYELAQALFGDIAVTQAYLTLSEVLGHVDLLLNEGRVREVELNGVAHFETA